MVHEKKEICSCLVKGVLTSYVHMYFISSHRCLQYNLPEHFYWLIFTASTLQWRGGPFSTLTYGTLMESCSVTVMTTTWTCLAQIWCSSYDSCCNGTCLVLFRGIRGHHSLTLSPFRYLFPLRHHTRDIWCQWNYDWCSQPTYWFQRKI